MTTNTTGGIFLYELFPPLLGPLSGWTGHMARAVAMGFDWLLVNPIQRPGASGSVHAIADFHDVNPVAVDASDPRPPWDQVAAAVDEAHRLGLKVMFDLVVQHAAADSPLVAEHPDWFLRAEDGSFLRPGLFEGDRRTKTWDDLVAAANTTSLDRDGLWAFWTGVVQRLLATGADGIRAHMAHQAPGGLWRQLIAHARAARPDVLLAAETLGCPDWQTVEVARLGFDLCFNSSKWWDFNASWCMDQYRATAPLTGTVGFPEAHDTPRLMAELDGDVAAVKLRYAFAALFSTGVMIPAGFEFGLRRRVDAPGSVGIASEKSGHDLRGFIAEVNRLKRAERVFHEDNTIERVSQPSPETVVLAKTSRDGGQRGLLVLNADRHRPSIVALRDLPALLRASRAREVTPGRAPGDAKALVGMLAPSELRVFVDGD